ncbi:cobalamin biosynthesis protein CbiX [Paraliobacillus quinghaiensis]|uniref:Cobalamin biosynthesis protein CbiX n=1 Tax=Paraliobacillus quinghaiensis TaxID=470815 RepID=A0A917WT42_9BACI|nr:CbiX/SirB N-terminal domain-containing protein [Paraliobacillus quinghaiensis]GGM25987.1 cobalamin biosynthesis protein CbiX [Paraliobacillus quinghaiensis]
MKAVLYIAHGSKNEQTNKRMRLELEKLSSLVDMQIQQVAFLEADPNIKEGIAQCVKKGATEIILMPVFLLPGVHVIKDIPEQVHSAQLTYPDVTIHIGEPLAASSQLITDTADRIFNKKIETKEKQAVLLVSHGSRYKEASETFQLFTEQLQKELKDISVYDSYLKTSEPSFKAKLEELVKTDYQVIYVVPHFFSINSFPEKIEQTVTAFQQMFNENSIVCIDPIDFNENIKIAIQNRVKMIDN